MKVRVDFDLTDEQVHNLQRLAIVNGYAREDPHRSWAPHEVKDAVRSGIHHIVEEGSR